MSEQHVDATLQAHLASGGGEINHHRRGEDCRVLARVTEPGETNALAMGQYRRLSRAIAFTNRISSSKRLEALLGRDRRASRWAVVREVERPDRLTLRDAPCRWEASRAGAQGPDRVAKGRIRRRLPHPLECTMLVRGHRRAGARRGVVHEPAQFAWSISCRPWAAPCARPTGKEYGYIVLPIAVQAGVDPAASALDDNERFSVLWSVLTCALRSHDDRFNAEINKIDLNDTPTEPDHLQR